MSEDVIGRFRQLLNQAENQDAVLRDLAQQKEPTLTIVGARPIKALFNEARGLLNDVAEYEYHANPASARSQIARLIAQLISAIKQLEADEAAYSRRNELAVPQDKALELLRTRVAEGRAFLDSYVVHDVAQVRRWCSEVIRTLKRLFSTSWHVQQFIDETKEEIAFQESLAGTGLSYLKQVIEDLLLSAPDEQVRQGGDAVFIAHGRSSEWRELKEYLQNVLGVKHLEFNSDPTAGYLIHERLVEMLRRSTLGFLVFTAEDEQTDGSLRARQNVVYEAGMWMGRFGPKRTIILRDHRCSLPSNLEGITSIEFSGGLIKATFVEVREVLVREGVLTPERR